MSQKIQGQEVSIMFGVVEDINDPEQLNRIRIRLPQHGSKTDTPTTYLPWAATVMPASGGPPNTGGPGGTAGLSVAKDSVVMVLVNHDNHENMNVLGVLPVNQIGKDIVAASAAARSSQALGGLQDGYTGGKFEPATNASKAVLAPAPPSFPQVPGKYPDTHVNVTKGGMRTVLHDVAGAVYQATIHPTGTFTEMQADGNYVTYTTKDRKEAVDGTYTLYSEKNMVIATNGNLQLKVKGNMLVEVEGKYAEYTVGRRTTRSGDAVDIGGKTVLVVGKENLGIAAPAVQILGTGKVDLNDPGGMPSAKQKINELPIASAIKSSIEDGTLAGVYTS